MSSKIYTAHRRLDETKLLVLTPEISRFSAVAQVGEFLRPNDLLVMNTSATLPANFRGHLGSNGLFLELRLAAFAGRDLNDFTDWWAISFGSGDWRQPTEERGLPPPLTPGDIIRVADDLRFQVTEVHESQKRLLRVKVLGANPLLTLYCRGTPIQYSYHRDPLEVWDVQTPLAQIPISVEPPSALFPFSWTRLLKLKEKIPMAYLLHGAGLSSTGDAELDKLLPLSEFFSVPKETFEAVSRAKATGGRVIAVGTTVARALESAITRRPDGEVAFSKPSGLTKLKLGSQRPAQIIDGLLTGCQEPQTSHFELESSILNRDRVREGFRQARSHRFMDHEFGDVVLLLRD